MSSTPVSLSPDDYVEEMQERRYAVWIAKLTDGTSVWMDDGRPGVRPDSAWLRLCDYVAVHKLRIVDIDLKFRTNRICNSIKRS